MTDQPIRVFFQASLGLAFRQATNEEKKKVGEAWEECAKKWKSSGVKLIGYFGAYGEALDGYGHNYIFEVDDVSKVQEMDADIHQSEFGKFVERLSLHVGRGHGTEEWWESL
jgi:hypothetical protein